jgi:hypothetical protein
MRALNTGQDFLSRWWNRRRLGPGGAFYPNGLAADYFEPCAQGFHSGLVEGGKKAGQGRSMGQVVSTKERHERLSKRRQPLVKSFERGLPTQRSR